MVFGTNTTATNVGVAISAARMIGATPAQTEPKFCAMGVGATGAARTAAVGDTALSSEVETRTTGAASSVTTTVTNDTYQCVGTIVATNSRSVDEASLMDASTVGKMFLSATFAIQGLSTGDSIQFTWKAKYAVA